MTEIAASRPQRPPTHPGELIHEILDDHLHLSVVDAARRLHVTRQALHAVLSGRAAVTPAMALRLGRLFGKDPALWLNMQVAHDLWHAEQTLASELNEIEAVHAA
ncbi:MAG TPA: HigA family addiction module antitoxin [Azospirillum sp.]